MASDNTTADAPRVIYSLTESVSIRKKKISLTQIINATNQ